MIKVPGPGAGRLVAVPTGAEPSVSALFTTLWDALADLLGTAATATLLRRAARRAQARSPELAELAIHREGLTYSYTCPPSWSGSSIGAPPALGELIGELRPLLIAMSGQVIIQALEQVLELRELVVLAGQEERS
jgi:hypothetical protein